MTDTAPTIYGTATIEPGVALQDLRYNDLVLGTPSPDMPVRTVHRVVGEHGHYRTPQEPPVSIMARLVGRFDRTQDGILVELAGVDGGRYPAMFTAETTPTLDRVTGWADPDTFGPDRPQVTT